MSGCDLDGQAEWTLDPDSEIAGVGSVDPGRGGTEDPHPKRMGAIRRVSALVRITGARTPVWIVAIRERQKK